MIEVQAAAPVLEPFAGQATAQLRMVVGVSERLKTVDTGGTAYGRTVVGDFAGRLHDFPEPLADLVEQAGAAGHRIPQQRIHLVAADVADHQNLQVVQVHVQHMRRTETQRLQDAVGGGGAVTGGKGEDIRRHVRMETDGIRRSAAPVGV